MLVCQLYATIGNTMLINTTMSTMLLTFLFMTLLFRAPFASLAAAATTGLRASMTRIDSGSSFTLTERFQRAVRRSHLRSELLGLNNYPSGHGGIFETAVKWGDFEYLMSAGIGTPAQTITAILDTGSDLIWTQCLPCFTCLPQPSPYYDPSDSTTFSFLPCSSPYCSVSVIPASGCILKLCQYSYGYGDRTVTQGLLGAETFTFDGTPVAGLAFGCGMVNNGTLSNSTGIVGMGRGPLSLPSQLQPQRFSYCLTPFESTKPSTLFLGSMAGLNPLGGSQSTPFVTNPAYPSFYYLGLHAISFGGTVLRIPRSAFELKPDGSGGVIIDSGTFLTMLNKKAYHVLRKEMVSVLHLPVAHVPDEEASLGFDLCFKLTGAPPPEMPKMVFHFEGGNMVLSWDKYMLLDAESGVLCSVIASTEGLTILGNYQQQDTHFVYDLEANLLSFAPAKCEQI